MKIEEVIQQQKPFSSVHQRAVVNLIYTSNWIERKFKQFLSPYGITNQQFNVLRILRGARGPLSTSKIRERLLDQMADSSRLVERLEQKGLVTKSTCPNDKRLVDVTLSEKGKQLLDSMDEAVTTNNNDLLKLTEQEAILLSNLLDKGRG